MRIKTTSRWSGLGALTASKGRLGGLSGPDGAATTAWKAGGRRLDEVSTDFPGRTSDTGIADSAAGAIVSYDTSNSGLFEQAFSNAPIGMALVGLDGRWLKVNRNICRIVGYDEASLLQKTFQDITFPPDLDADLAKVEQLKSGFIDSYQMEKRYICADGKLVWVRLSVSLVRDSGNSPQFFISQIEDIHAAKLAEEATHELEQRWHFALESANHGVWDWNVQAGEVFYSTGWKRMLGYKEHEIGNSPAEWSDRGHPDDMPRAMAELSRHWRGEVDTYVCEHRVRCKDGTYKLVLDRGRVVCWTPDKKPLRMVGTYTDLSEIRDAQQKLASQAKALETANTELAQRNEELQRFTRLASHDLREPLRAISGFASLLHKRLADHLVDEDLEFFKFIDAGVKRMDEMIRALGELARLDQHPIAHEPFPMDKVVEEALDNIETAVQASGAEVVIEDLPKVPGSRILLVQLMQHILGNAVKYRREIPPQVLIGAKFEGGQYHFTVTDNGVGILPKDIPLLFEPFRGASHNGIYAGTSVGLTFSKRIVERHGGRIWIESVPGTGTTVHFTLPADSTQEIHRKVSDRRRRLVPRRLNDAEQQRVSVSS